MKTDRVRISSSIWDTAHVWLFCPGSSKLEISGFADKHWANDFGGDLLGHLTPILTKSRKRVKVGFVAITVEKINRQWVVVVSKNGEIH